MKEYSSTKAYELQNSYPNEFIQFLNEITMICSFDGLIVDQTLHNQTLTNLFKNNLNATLFQITLKPFLYKGQLYILIIVKDVTLFNHISIL